MDDQQLLNRITIDPRVMTGKPVIRGTRLTVDYILGLLARGATEAEILGEYSGLTAEDIRACYLFASKALGGNSMPHMPGTDAIKGIQRSLDAFEAGRFRSFSEFAAEQRQKHGLSNQERLRLLDEVGVETGASLSDETTNRENIY